MQLTIEPVKEPERPVHLRLVQDRDKVRVFATNGLEQACVVSFYVKTGTVHRHRHISPTLGFTLDDQGRIETANKYFDENGRG